MTLLILLTGPKIFFKVFFAFFSKNMADFLGVSKACF